MTKTRPAKRKVRPSPPEHLADKRNMHGLGFGECRVRAGDWLIVYAASWNGGMSLPPPFKGFIYSPRRKAKK